MGFGFRCGFLGLLHMEIVQERLEREYDLDLIITAPSVVYRCKMHEGEDAIVDNPTKLPNPEQREFIMEPYVRCGNLCGFTPIVSILLRKDFSANTSTFRRFTDS